jgi:quercetin dioxygenase-like cupin family protein
VNFKKGDFLFFGKDTVHAWKNGPKETQILFLKATPPK